MHFHSCLYWQVEELQANGRRNYRWITLNTSKRGQTMINHGKLLILKENSFDVWKTSITHTQRTARWPTDFQASRKYITQKMLVRNCKPAEHLKCDLRTWVQLTRSWVAQKCPFYRLWGSWWAAPSLLLGAPNKLHSSCISTATPHQPASIKWGPFGWCSGVRHTRGLTWLGFWL